MIQVIIKTNTIRDMKITVEPTSTPRSIFDDKGIDVAGSTINLDGTILGATDLNSTFEALGVESGQTVRLNSVIKMDGAI